MTNERIDTLITLGRLTEAEELAKDCLSQNPDDAFTQVLLARTLFRQNRVGPAADVINRAVACDPEFAYGHRIKGMILATSGFRVEADRAYTRALTLDPYDPYTYLQRAQLDIASVMSKPSVARKLTSKATFLGDLTRARTDLDEAMRLAPERPAIHVGLAHLHRAEAKPTKTRQAAQRALQLDPLFGPAHEILGELAEERQDIRAAGDHYVAAGRSDPTDPGPLAKLKNLGAPALAVPAFGGYVVIRVLANGVRLGGTAIMIGFAIVLGAVLIAVRIKDHRAAQAKLSPQALRVIEADRATKRSRFRRET